MVFFAIFINVFVFCAVNKEAFLKPYNHAQMAQVYSNSQYVLGPAAKEGIGDDGLYAFSGYYYFMQKGDPSKVNFEHPPLGKYLIGLSLFTTKNENMINLFYFFAICLLAYKLGQLILKDNLLSLLSVWVITLNPLFLSNLVNSMLDLPFVLFFLGGVYFFILGIEKPSLLYISSFFWGLAFSIKFFPAIIFIFGLFFLLIFIYKRKLVITFLLSWILVPFIYLLTHLVFFYYHPSLVEFIKHKVWMIRWWTGSPIIPGNILRNILTGFYLDTQYKLQHTYEWNLITPIVVILGILRFRRNIFKKNNLALLTLYTLSFIYLFVFLTFLNGGVLKFLMPIFPLLSLLAIDNLKIIFHTRCGSSGINKTY